METKVVLSPDKNEIWLIDQDNEILVIMSVSFYKYHYGNTVDFMKAKEIMLMYFREIVSVK